MNRIRSIHHHNLQILYHSKSIIDDFKKVDSTQSPTEQNEAIMEVVIKHAITWDAMANFIDRGIVQYVGNDICVGNLAQT